MNIAVLYGGKSGEHEVSLRSASSVVRHINRTKHTIILIGIAKDGRWYLQSQNELTRVLADDSAFLRIDENPACLMRIVPGGGAKAALQSAVNLEGRARKPDESHAVETDIVLPVLHGSYGEDGLVQGLLEMAELPYCGCTALSSALAMDKEQTKKVWMQEGLQVVPFVCITNADMQYEGSAPRQDSSAPHLDGSAAQSGGFEKIAASAEKQFGYPLFVKPVCAGSSVGAAKAHSREELKAAVENAFLWDEKVLIEQCIDAREIECSVTGNAAISASGKTAVKSYTPGEIAPAHGFYDYDAKYTDPDGARLLIPAPLTEEEAQRVKTIAEKAYRALDCSGLARVDFFIDKKDGTLYLNEINTLPGFTSISMFPKMCEAAGLAYEELIELLLEQGIERFKKRRSLKTSFV
ncbi:D-alanine--D-alanine ligase family protein [Treponema sp. HNW]|uniref:D-alanine--D-alanine ligase family protein n=1 Tax=Treponema sp. HNW TaxID=3116654 RepID=UPI003D0D4F9B